LRADGTEGDSIVDFVAIDFETANEQRHSACAIGMAVVEDGTITDQHSMLIRPPDTYFNPFNVDIHGITWEDVKNEPDFAELWPTISSCIGGRIVLAHNASFDMSVMRYCLDLCELTYPELCYSCTMVMARQLWKGLMSYSLPVVADHLGICFQHHDALEDAVACAAIGVRAFEETGSQSFDDLATNLEMLHGHLFPGGYKCAGKRRQRTRLTADDVLASTDEFDPEHPFYGRTVVFTGTLQSMKRQDAMQRVVDAGGRCGDRVNSDTGLLVVGEQDLYKLRGGAKSNKMKAVERLIAKGVEVEVIGEEDFLQTLGELPTPDG